MQQLRLVRPFVGPIFCATFLSAFAWAPLYADDTTPTAKSAPTPQAPANTKATASSTVLGKSNAKPAKKKDPEDELAFDDEGDKAGKKNVSGPVKTQDAKPKQVPDKADQNE